MIALKVPKSVAEKRKFFKKMRVAAMVMVIPIILVWIPHVEPGPEHSLEENLLIMSRVITTIVIGVLMSYSVFSFESGVDGWAESWRNFIRIFNVSPDKEDSYDKVIGTLARLRQPAEEALQAEHLARSPSYSNAFAQQQQLAYTYWEAVKIADDWGFKFFKEE